MNAPRLVVAAVAAVVVLSGCTAEPEPVVAPPSVGVVPEQYRTAAPTPTPTPSATGGIRTIAAPDSVECRTPTDAERAAVGNLARATGGKPMRAVDAGQGWAVVAFWMDGATHSVITNGERVNWIGAGWGGYFRPAGVRLQGGEAARLAALRCVA